MSENSNKEEQFKRPWAVPTRQNWPGRAKTLKVNKIFCTSKNLFIRTLWSLNPRPLVTHRSSTAPSNAPNETSFRKYQEVRAHLPLAGHPNPKKALAIGGGDGQVVREALKHDTVEEVVLCDIDGAVIRVSKKYLPQMSALLDSPPVKVFAGDGFKRGNLRHHNP
ncbi:hypothetical protein BDR04DRAFT_1165164 [Suillus decipiens]|nr:hypothetical protein BDR04DRAFT_1165164 [Suillus decipiens]